MEGIVDTCFEEGNTQIVRTILTVTAELTIYLLQVRPNYEQKPKL